MKKNNVLQLALLIIIFSVLSLNIHAQTITQTKTINSDGVASEDEMGSDSLSEKEKERPARKLQILPIVMRLDGVGEIYGAAVGIKNIARPQFNVHVGATTGDVEASVFSISDFKVGKNTFNYQLFNLDELNLQTQYSRSTHSGLVFQQLLSGSGHHFGFEHQFNNSQLSSNVDLVLSEISFEGYLDDNGNKIDINMDGLNDVSSTMLRYSLHLDERENANFSAGSQLKSALSVTVGRDGQSDQGQWDYQMSQHYLVHKNVLVSAYIKGSHSMVLSENEDYDTDAEIRAELDAQCNVLTGTEQQTCIKLEESLIAYVLASNQYGTASAIGGGAGLRSYGEQFFRGANTFLEGLEVEYQIPNFSVFKGDRKLHLVAFAESAQVNDQLEDSFDDSLHSVGLGLRTYADDLVLCLETAHGENGNAWAFRAGMPY